MYSTQLILYFYLVWASCHAYHHEYILYIRVESKVEEVIIELGSEEGNPLVEVGFNISGPSKEPDPSAEQGKPWMHLTFIVITNFYSLDMFDALSS